jgi:hypothetical protein
VSCFMCKTISDTPRPSFSLGHDLSRVCHREKSTCPSEASDTNSRGTLCFAKAGASGCPSLMGTSQYDVLTIVPWLRTLWAAIPYFLIMAALTLLLLAFKVA